MGRGVVRLLLVLVLLIAIAATLFAWARNEYRRPGPLAETTIVRFEQGIGIDGVAKELARSGVIRSATAFIGAARLTGVDRRLRAGEYAFGPRINIAQVLVKLVRGDVVVRKLTVPEGLTTRQIVALIEATPALSGAAPARLREGSLLPETYHYSWGDTRAGLLARMRSEMSRVLLEAWSKRDPDLPLDSVEEALILASIVEKETSVPAERAHIAGVFVNRLRKGMRLQSDPTVAYGISAGEPLGRPLTKRDLDDHDLYNTYQHAGLPPGPIANPGRATIEAVMQPFETDDLYFVADGSGGHAFASTLEEHNRNVRRLRDRQRKEQ